MHPVNPEQTFDKLFARKQGSAVDPRLSTGPAAHIGRRKQVLTKPGCQHRKRQRIGVAHAKLAHRAGHQFDRAFDQRGAMFRRVETRRREDAAQRHLNVIPAGAKCVRDADNFAPVGGGVSVRRYKLAPQFGNDELGRSRLCQQDVEHCIAVKIAAAAEHGFDTIVMLHAADQEGRAVFPVHTPAGEGARGFLDVALAVMPFTQGEQLHHLTRKIFIRLTLAAGGCIEVNQHRRVFGGGMQQRAEVAQRVLAQQHVLAVHQLRRAHLLRTRHKVVMPKQRHALGQRRRRLQHLRHPPRLELGIAQGLALLKRAPLGIGQVPYARRVLDRLLHPGWWRSMRSRACRRQQLLHGLLPVQPGKAFYLTLSGRKPAAREQMPCIVRAKGSGLHRSGKQRQQAHQPNPAQCVHAARTKRTKRISRAKRSVRSACTDNGNHISEKFHHVRSTVRLRQKLTHATVSPTSKK